MDDLIFGARVSPAEIYAMTCKEIVALQQRYVAYRKRVKAAQGG